MNSSSIRDLKEIYPKALWVNYQHLFLETNMKPEYECILLKKGKIFKNSYIFTFYKEFILTNKKNKKRRIIFLENLCVEWLFSKDPKSMMIKYTGIKFVKCFYDQLLFYNTNEILTNLKRYLDYKINLFNFYQFYQPIKQIGMGSFAKVYFASNLLETEKYYAIKAFSKEALIYIKHGKESVFNEIRILRNLNHINILKLYQVFETETTYYLIMELCHGGNLAQKIKKLVKLPETLIVQIMKGILNGVNCMHSQNIMHRDLKIENIMFKENLEEQDESPDNIRIIDFGLSKYSKNDDQNDKLDHLFLKCGTPGYISPEILNCNPALLVSEKCDIFSLGVIFHMMLFGVSPFPGRDMNEVLKKNSFCYIDHDDSLYQTISPITNHLLFQMLEPIPSLRISASECLNHPFFDKETRFVIESDFEVKMIENALMTNSKLVHFGSPNKGSPNNGKTKKVLQKTNFTNKNINPISKLNLSNKEQSDIKDILKTESPSLRNSLLASSMKFTLLKSTNSKFDRIASVFLDDIMEEEKSIEIILNE